MAPKIIAPADSADAPYALYEIPTRQGPQYLRVDRNPGRNGKRMIVLADSARLLKLWSSPAAQGGRRRWESSSGYAQVQKRFASSHHRPLSLPRVELKAHHLACLIGWLRRLFKRRSKVACYELSLIEGENRTLWLLANDAQTIPLECPARHAKRLHQLIGRDGEAPESVEQLLPPRKTR